MPAFFDIHGDPTMDPYTILSLPPTATEADIKKAYRMQMLQLHPDKLSPTLSENSIAAVTEKFHNVKDAYEFLTSPVHLTSRRLYMAKMASRRAEYERREAFLRRNGNMMNMNTSAYASQGVSGYRSGGGGAAGMAGTGMEPPQAHYRTNSYNVPTSGGGGNKDKSSSKMYRSKSEPGFGEGDLGGGGKQGEGRGRSRRSGEKAQGAHPPATRGRSGKMHNSHHTATKNKSKSYSRGERNGGYKSDTAGMNFKGYSRGERNGGYKSDTAGMNFKSRSSTNKVGNKSSSRKDNENKEHRKRTKSEPRYQEKKSTSNNKDRKSRDRDARAEVREQQQQQQRREERRRRAKSAPARYANKKDRDRDRDRNNTGSSSPRNSLPKEFYCPLTKRLMKDPVSDQEGNTYEREAIERWLRVQSSSPITNGYLCLDMLRPDRELKRAIYKATGKPRSKSQTRTKTRSSSPNSEELISGRVLIDSYLREISSKSKLSVSLDGMGICAFSYRRITFVIEVPITPHAGFMVYSSFDGEADKYKLAEKMDAWNGWLTNIGRHSRVSYVRAGAKTVFTLKGSERDMSKCDVFQKTLEYFVEMSLKLHNLLHPAEAKAVENVCLTRAPVVLV